jgi:adenine phosphoribosyltransferase
MATLDALKQALRQKATSATASSPPLQQPLSDAQYSAGFDILAGGDPYSGEWTTYQEFIIPQLSQLLTPLFDSRIHVSVLEIGPGPKTVLGYLPDRLRRKIGKYTALEPNGLFAGRLEEWLGSSTSETSAPMPCLKSPPVIHRTPFVAEDVTGSGAGPGAGTGGGGGDKEKFDVILFCHSMYGMKPKHRFIRRALEMLVEGPADGLVVVFHREGLYIDGLVSHRTACFSDGVVRVAHNNDEVLDRFSTFIAGFTTPDEAVRAEWRGVCRALGRRGEQDHDRDHLVFRAPNVMAAFTRHATALPELAAEVPLVTPTADNNKTVIKNHEARLHHPAAVVKPTEIRHIQACVRWALRCGVGLTVVGGGHSGHCLWPNVVAVDMGAFDQVHVVTAAGEDSDSDSSTVIVAGAGCKTGDIVRKAMGAGLAVPLGARPSVGAGLWLQGGIGHLARQHGLACDAVVGAVVVSVESGELLVVGRMPTQHWPAGAVRPGGAKEADMLWALKGAGTNFGIVVSVTFQAYAAPTYAVRNWVAPLRNKLEAQHKLGQFSKALSPELPPECSVDAYLYWNNDRLHLGMTVFATSTDMSKSEIPTAMASSVITGPQADVKIVDGVGVFESEMYMSGMHGGHSGGKTSSFKRCLFLKDIGEASIADILVAAVETPPTPLCYLHLLHGSGAVSDAAADASAFGCRDWGYACVITGVWPRNQDGTEAAHAAVRWVYRVAGELLPFSNGVYSADLGPDPRDAALAAKAFGPNLPRLARLKRNFDSHNVLSYACPLPSAPMEPKLIVLVTGESGAGKDHCANAWAPVFAEKGLTARVVSISETTKREYAAATGAELDRLLRDRAYKEQHRPALTAFFQKQVQQRPRLPEEQFLNAVYGAAGVDVLFITGMRDEAPVAALSHLVPDSKLIDVCVTAGRDARRVRRMCLDPYGTCVGDMDNDGNNNAESDTDGLKKALDYCPSLIFENYTTGTEPETAFAEYDLLPFVHEDLQRLANMVRPVPGFPRPGIQFRHVLGISQQPGGLALCTSLLKRQFTGDWARIDVVACCEAGGFIYAAPLATSMNVPLALIRDAGKLPPPTVSVAKSPSHISSGSAFNDSEKEEGKEGIEMERDVVPRGASVLVVDDVLATGETLCAILRLLEEAGVGAGRVSVMVVAEFPVHRGRELLRRHGFGGVKVQSLLVFGGA